MLITSLISHSSFSTYVIFRVLHFCEEVISLLKNSAFAMPCGIQSECLSSILDKSSFSGGIKLLSAEPLLFLCFCALRCGSAAKRFPTHGSIFNFCKYYQRWAGVPVCRNAQLPYRSLILTSVHFGGGGEERERERRRSGSGEQSICLGTFLIPTEHKGNISLNYLL